MKKKKLLIASLLCHMLAACAFVPKVDEEQIYADKCDMYTKKLTLTAVEFDNLNCGDGSPEMCLAILLGAPAITLVASGSIVIVGNTIHWVEYQGSCDGGYIAEYVSRYKQRINET